MQMPPMQGPQGPGPQGPQPGGPQGGPPPMGPESLMSLLTSLMQQGHGGSQAPGQDANQQQSLQMLLPMILQMISGAQPSAPDPSIQGQQPPGGPQGPQQGGGDPAQLMQMLQQMGLNIGR